MVFTHSIFNYRFLNLRGFVVQARVSFRSTFLNTESFHGPDKDLSISAEW